MAVTAALAATGVGTAQSAPDTACPAPYPEGQLTQGQPVTGLTVSGTTSPTAPEPFSGTVLGVIKNGIAPGMDMIMTRLTSPEIDRVGGIWQGMSGSPVYAADGRLVGAVAYGLSFGSSPVAGVTPAADMESLLDSGGTTAAKPSARVAIPAPIARTMVATGSATQSEVLGGMTQLRIPFGVSGLAGRQRLRDARRLLHLGNVRLMHGSAAEADAAPSAIVPGGNLAVSLSYGDVTAAGIGTATAVCGSEVLAFGHPMNFSGRSTMTMHGAETLYVQEDLIAPFKVANLTGPVGTIDQDRLEGVHGVLGTLPRTSPVTSYVESEGRSRTGTTLVSVQSMFPDVATMHLLSDQDRVLDAYGPGTGRVSWTIRGLREDGSPFRLFRTDMYADQYDISGGTGFTLYDTLSRLQNNDTDQVTFTAVHTTSRLSTGYRHYVLGTVQLRRAGHWVTLRPHRGLSLRAGRDAVLRVRLTSANLANRWIGLTVPVPPRAAGLSGSLDVLGGNTAAGEGYGNGSSAGLDDVLRQLRRAPHHDVVYAHLSLLTQHGATLSRSASAGATQVVDGSATFRVRGVR